MDLGLSGSRAITGDSAGIGLGIACTLVSEGAAVAAYGRDLRRLVESGLPAAQLATPTW